jgi:hypothetical protein
MNGIWRITDDAIAAAIGGSYDIGIDCNSPIIIETSGTSISLRTEVSQGSFPPTFFVVVDHIDIAPATVTIQFSDIYDLNDYL